MNYVYNYALGSILFGSLTMIFFFREKRIRDFQDRLYSLLLICAFVAVIFDALSAAIEPVANSFPAAIVYASNIIFLLSMQSCLPALWQYSLCAAGTLQNYSYRRRVLLSLPYLAVLFCLLLSPFCRAGIFYLDEVNAYKPGMTHSILYVNASYFMIMSTAMLCKNFKSIQKEKRIVILIFSALVFLSMLLQILFPRYLLTSSACMLAVSAVFYVMQSPLEMRDPLTGSCNRILLPSILTNYHQQRIGYTLLLFSLRSFDQICEAYGSDIGDEVLKHLARALQESFPDDLTVYMDTAEFTVICTREIKREEIEQINAARPRYTVCSVGRIPIELSMAAILHSDDESPKLALSAMDYLYGLLPSQQSGELLFADSEFQIDCAKRMNLESNIEDVLQNGKPVVGFDPILRWGRSPCGAELNIKIEHSACEEISSARLLQACEQTGLAWRHLALMLKSASAYREQFNSKCRLLIPFSIFLCMSPDASERILDMARTSGFEPEQLCLCAPESQVASASESTIESLMQIASLGFALCLDAFAEGYSDIVLLTRLPLFAVRISPDMFSRAAHDMRQLKLLRGTVDILHRLGIVVICSGVNSMDDASVAAAADITMLQGDFVRGAADFPKIQ